MSTIFGKSDASTLLKKKDDVLSSFSKVISDLSLVALNASEERTRQEEMKAEIEKEIENLAKVESESNDIIAKFTQLINQQDI